jgi:hypothetical protein
VTFYDDLFYGGPVLQGNVLGTSSTKGGTAVLHQTFSAGMHYISASGGGINSLQTAPESIVDEEVFPNVGLYRPGTNTLLIDYDHNGTVDASVAYASAAPGEVALVGDVLGNGKDAFVLYRSGTWYVDSKQDGTADIVYSFGGEPGDVPLLADMDGDGKADLVIFRAGTWYVSTNRDGVVNEVYQFGGDPGDIPLIATTTLDGINDLIIYNNGAWQISYGRDSTVDVTFNFGGQPQDRPLLSTWASRAALPMIFRDGQWLVRYPSDGTVVSLFESGAAGDIPLLGTFQGTPSPPPPPPPPPGGDVLSNPTLQLASAAKGIPITGVIATFTDSNTSAITADFTALINWGDHTQSTGVVSSSAGAFSVSAPPGGHTYTERGSVTVSVHLTEVANGTASSTATGTVEVK